MDEVEVLERLVSQQEAMVEKVQMVGRKVLENLDEGSDKKETEEKLSDLEKRWENLNSKLVERKSVVKNVLEVSKELHRDSGNFQEWLTKTESRVNNSTLQALDPESIEEKQKEFKDIVEEVRCKKPVQENLAKTTENLTEICEADEEIVESETNSLRKRWEALGVSSKEKQDGLAQVKELVSEFDGSMKTIDETLDEVEDITKSNRCVGIDKTSVLTSLDELEGRMERVADVEDDVDKMKSVTDEILSHVTKNSPLAEMMEMQVKSITERYYQTKNELIEYFIRFQNESMMVIKFWMIYETVEEGLPALVEEVDALSPVSTKPAIITRQLLETEGLLEDAERYKEKIEAVEEFAEEVLIINRNDPKVVKFVQGKLSEVRTQSKKVTHTLEERFKKLQASSMKGKDYEDLKEQLQDRLSALDVAMGSERPISGVYEKTKTQKDDADRVVGTLKQLEPVYEKVKENGQSLLECCPEDEERCELREEIEKLTSMWENACAKANRRGEDLQTALPLTKSYSMTRDDFVTWLSGAERKVGNVEEMPMDLDNIEKIEQRLVEIGEDVGEHEGMLGDYVALTKKVEEACEDVVVVETEAKDVDRRWNELRKKLEEKKLAAEKVNELLKQHHKALVEIQDTNEEIEKMVKSKDLYQLESETMKDTLEKAKVYTTFKFCEI